ncbi:MAG TPA: peroxiredoxin [Ktedonobacterales bacterium]|jgi:peroxiredoxin Q/BCP
MVATKSNPAKGKVRVGDLAPDFTLPTQSGEQVTLSSFQGKKAVVLYFYPRDYTPGCTAEACAFRDSYEVFKDAGAEVIGVSSGSEESHQRFGASYHLPFLLLSDKKSALRKRYGVSSVMGLLPGRVTYIIDKEGIVRHIFKAQFAAEKHVTVALETIKSLSDN